MNRETKQIYADTLDADLRLAFGGILMLKSEASAYDVNMFCGDGRGASFTITPRDASLGMCDLAWLVPVTDSDSEATLQFEWVDVQVRLELEEGKSGKTPPKKKLRGKTEPEQAPADPQESQDPKAVLVKLSFPVLKPNEQFLGQKDVALCRPTCDADQHHKKHSKARTAMWTMLSDTITHHMGIAEVQQETIKKIVIPAALKHVLT